MLPFVQIFFSIFIFYFFYFYAHIVAFQTFSDRVDPKRKEVLKGKKEKEKQAELRKTRLEKQEENQERRRRRPKMDICDNEVRSK